MGLNAIIKPLFPVLTSAINKSLQFLVKNSWKRRESNPEPLGAKRECCPLSYAAPIAIWSKNIPFPVNARQFLLCLLGSNKGRHRDIKTLCNSHSLWGTVTQAEGGEGNFYFCSASCTKTEIEKSGVQGECLCSSVWRLKNSTLGIEPRSAASIGEHSTPTPPPLL